MAMSDSATTNISPSTCESRAKTKRDHPERTFSSRAMVCRCRLRSLVRGTRCPSLRIIVTSSDSTSILVTSGPRSWRRLSLLGCSQTSHRSKSERHTLEMVIFSAWDSCFLFNIVIIIIITIYFKTSIFHAKLELDVRPMYEFDL